MSKDLDYEFNNFANLLHKDCMNLMECLKKQGEDNKPILYLGKHYKKVILPYEEYQKMCNRLEAIDNANPSEALMKLNLLLDRANHDEILSRKSIDFCEKWIKEIQEAYDTIEQALLKAQEPKQYVDELKLVEKKLKALEIIKEKRVDIESFYSSFIERDFNYYFYSSWYRGYGRKQLTEEEFELLKEVLE